MVRFMHTTDWHLGKKNYGLEFRKDDFASVAHRASDIAIGKYCDFVVHSGDLFDNRALDPDTLYTAVDILESLKHVGIGFYVVVGNHEQAPYGKTYSWVQYLDRRGLVKCLDSELVIEDGIKIAGAGYCGRRVNEVVRDMVEEFDLEPPTIMILHAALGDKLAHVGNLSEETVELLTGKVDYLALGHVHKPYVDGIAHCPGALENCSLGEAKWETGVFVVDLDDRGMTKRFVPIEKRPFLEKELDVNGKSLQCIYDDVVWSISGRIEESMIVITLTGYTDLAIDKDEIKRILKDAKYVRVRDRTEPLEYKPDVQWIPSGDLERDVMIELWKDKGYDNADEMADLTIQVKEGVLADRSLEDLL